MQFADILGQEHVRRILQNSLASGRLSHAYLFWGARGLGKRTLAGVFAQALNCRAGGLEPCGVCSSCYKATQGSHPDIQWLRPQGASIKIEQVRQMEAQVAYKPYEGRYKVFIIEQADKLTEAASNSLLKTLEEPPEATIFILTAENSAQILPTIKSRCEPLRFQPVAEEKLTAYLRQTPQGAPLAPDQLRLLVAIAAGSIGRALELAKEPSHLALRNEGSQIHMRLCQEGIAAAFSLTHIWEKRQDEHLALLEQLTLWYRDLLRSALGLGSSTQFEHKQALPGIWQALQQIERTRQELQQNANARLALSNLFVKLAGFAAGIERT